MENNNLSGEKKPEMITDKNGTQHHIKSLRDIGIKNISEDEIKHYKDLCSRDLFPDELIAVKVLCENGIYLKKGFLDPNRTSD